jgi:predicted adenine nucleotide alpha hydrolase (AANH) superfamily ATPase
METLFLHVCCGPCAAYPLERLKADRPDLKPEMWFYNPNIHPRAEFQRRRDSLAYFAARSGLTVDFSPPYEASDFLAALGPAPSPPGRCRICYARRLAAAAAEAARRGRRLFGSTLAFSRHQNHDLIIEEGRRAAADHGLDFYYEDWRPGWRRGHEIAREMGLYRQNYCGCIYSELER